MSRYTNHYGVSFLDDLHNYFPDLLYAPVDQFPTVASVLNYVRQQMRDRFDLYSAGARAAAAGASGASGPRRAGPGPVAPAAPAPIAPSVSAASSIPSSDLNEQIRITYSTDIPNRLSRGDTAIAHDLENDTVTNNLMNLLMGGMTAPVPPRLPRRAVAPSGLDALNLLNLAFSGGGGGLNLFGPAPTVGVPANFMDPVPVRPTAAQIDAGTVIETVDAEEEVCAICQDDMPAGSEARALRACDHRFHVGCIDTWFQRDVRCPVCRHDIREDADVAAPPGGEP